MLQFLSGPWHWAISGMLIGLIVPALLIIGNKSFGISSSLRHVCAACFPADITFFKYNWKKESWNLYFALGIILGGFLANYFLKNNDQIALNSETISDLKLLGITNFNGLMPVELFGVNAIFSLKGLFFLVIGGFLVGFGTRYAGGCTSGHSIMGISNLQWPSLVATIFFMLGGYIMTNFILPLVLIFLNK
jgi:uncharacterized membrane protein YedE/YeeE